MNNQDDRDTLLPCPFRLVMIIKGMGYDGCANMILTDETEFPVGIIPSALVSFLQNYIDNWNTRDEAHLKQKIRTVTLDEVKEVIDTVSVMYGHSMKSGIVVKDEIRKEIDNLRGTKE